VETARQKKVRTVVQNRHPGIIVVLEDVHDPHNAAAIMRTCDALGIQDVWLVFKEEPAYNPRRVGKSSSSSANKWLTFTTYKSTEACCADLDSRGYVSIATVLDNPTDTLDAFDGARYERIALWVGNEHRGLSDVARAHARHRMTLTMRGMVESLNVSVATALFLFAIVTARRAAGITGLSLTEQEALYHELISR
jgi:tRNA (guanosine-2'-O-)-methyltransferase